MTESTAGSPAIRSGSFTTSVRRITRRGFIGRTVEFERPKEERGTDRTVPVEGALLLKAQDAVAGMPWPVSPAIDRLTAAILGEQRTFDTVVVRHDRQWLTHAGQGSASQSG